VTFSASPCSYYVPFLGYINFEFIVSVVSEVHTSWDCEKDSL